MILEQFLEALAMPSCLFTLTVSKVRSVLPGSLGTHFPGAPTPRRIA